MKNRIQLQLRFTSHVVWLALLSLGLILVGCRSSSPSVSSWPASGAIVKGMSEAEVHARLGDPTSVDEFTEGSMVARVWRYEDEYSVGSLEGANASGSQSQEDRMVERIIIEVLFVDGQVISMKERREVGEMGQDQS